MRNVDKLLRCLFVMFVCMLLVSASLVEADYSVQKGFLTGKTDAVPVTSLAVLEKTAAKRPCAAEEHSAVSRGTGNAGDTGWRKKRHDRQL